MMLSILSPLHAQAAAIRALGYAVSTQLRVAQIFACSAINAPMAQVRAIQAAASLPSEVTRAVAAVRTEDRPGKVAPLPRLTAAPEPEDAAPAAAHPAPVVEATAVPVPPAASADAATRDAASVVPDAAAGLPEAPAKAEARPARRRKAPSAPAPMPAASAKSQG